MYHRFFYWESGIVLIFFWHQEPYETPQEWTMKRSRSANVKLKVTVDQDQQQNCRNDAKHGYIGAYWYTVKLQKTKLVRC
jgi:hypothetical protein